MGGNSPISAEQLRRMYYAEGLTLREMGERLDVAGSTVSRWLDEHDIDRRTRGTRTGPVSLRYDSGGYPFWSTKIDGEQHQIRVHQLLAIAEYGTKAVADNVVHHRNGVPWDNRPENIEVVDRGEHLDIHRVEHEKRRQEILREKMAGEKNRASKLTADQVVDIRARYDSGEHPSDIAADYPISENHARTIGKRDAWKHIREQT